MWRFFGVGCCFTSCLPRPRRRFKAFSSEPPPAARSGAHDASRKRQNRIVDRCTAYLPSKPLSNSLSGDHEFAARRGEDPTSQQVYLCNERAGIRLILDVVDEGVLAEAGHPGLAGDVAEDARQLLHVDKDRHEARLGHLARALLRRRPNGGST